MPAVEAGALIAGRYRLETRLDAGGGAAVWRASDEELRRDVAVKILVTPSGGDPSFLEAFRGEAQAEAALKHPNIVEVFDWGHDGDANFVVMELLAGRTVREHLDYEGPVGPGLTVEVGRQVASALDYAHHEGIAHGNLDPGMIVVGADGHATVIGFGLQHRIAAEAGVSPDADTYALGGVLYEMLAGASPFAARPSELAADQPWPQPLRRFAPDAPHELDRIIMRAIAPEPSARYASAAQLRADLDALVKPKDRALLWTILAIVAVLLAVGVTWLVTTQRSVVVPDIAGKTPTEAAAVLGSAGLKMVVTGQIASTSVATNTIAAESPAAGQKVRAGTQIGVVLSTGLPTVSVPSVVGIDLQSASGEVASAGLVVGKAIRQNSSTYPADTVISASPAPGASLPKGSTVDLIVSAGQATVTMPDVRGISRANATGRLTNLGLKIDVGQQYSAQPVGRVVSQGPAPGATVPAGATITISVSQGPAPVTVPDVTNATKANATATLLGLGLVPVISTEASGTEPSQKGLVVNQDPEGGSSAGAGSKVRITIGN